MMRKKTILKKLAVVLNKLSGYYDAPVVLDKENGFRQPTLCWDGPYEWVMFTGGQSYLCGEVGNYSLKIEPELQKILDLAKENGYYFEPETSNQLCLAD